MICFDSELFPQNFVLQLNNDQKSLDFYYNALIKSSELWQISVNRKARQVVEAEPIKGRTTMITTSLSKSCPIFDELSANWFLAKNLAF